MRPSLETRLQRLEQTTHDEPILLRVIYAATDTEPEVEVYRYLVPPGGRPYRGDEDEP
jgi:hypothetical protein